ncbi:hypothetical protein [Spiroplasma culicicola]|uniref:Uncharacterized protein n=1 Tax=Spiroplasma culicicola AES-1 TaxID=1276246 RepID=W6A697_9MOLU|nr:hypothetical protein [Spiroplasma culicicola]AHI52476.1 hypothetical protein SCULI_v1c01350 [Spiroplasma culicicola AES-1]
MARKIQPYQLITYPKKITYANPKNNKNNFWDLLFKIIAIEVVSILVGTLTAGVGGAAVQTWGFSQLGIASTQLVIRATVDFTIHQMFDSSMGIKSSKNTLLNLFFSFSNIGSLGRARKTDKIIKILNEHQLLNKIGIKYTVNNLFEIKKALQYKKIILSNNKKITFSKKITDLEILQTIMAISSKEMKSSLKRMSQKELQALIEMEKLLYKVSPDLFADLKNLNTTKYNNNFKQAFNLNIDEFLNLKDKDAIEILLKLNKNSKISKEIIMINRLRIQKQLQETLIASFKDIGKVTQNTLNMLNPQKYLEIAIDKLLAPIYKSMDKIIKNSRNNLIRLNKNIRRTIKKYNIYACNPNSSFIGFIFKPISFLGDGYIELWKEISYKSTTDKDIKKYSKLVFWTNIKQVEEFSYSKNQDYYFNIKWKNKKNINKIEAENLNNIYEDSINSLKHIKNIKELLNRQSIRVKNINPSKIVNKISDSLNVKFK